MTRNDRNGITFLDDAAIAAGKGRIPSKEQWEELFSKCTRTTEAINGVSCFRLKGPNGNTLVLPCTGGRVAKTGLVETSSSYYWANSLSDLTTYYYVPCLKSNTMSTIGRSLGCQIRPVK